MNSQIVWQDEYDLGVEIIDKEHQRLLSTINELFRCRDEGQDSRGACQEGVRFFGEHAVKHFQDEEAYMASIGYEGLERHQRIHQDFRENTLPALVQELEQTDYSPDSVDHFLGVCAGWLIGHTLTEDQAITGRHTSTWKDLLPEDETAAMKTVITQLVSDLFRLESQMISDRYGGEEFGKGVYYRLVFGRPQDEKQLEVIMVFEEKLLLNTTGKLLGLQNGKLDAMMLNATRYTTKQFVTHVIDRSPSFEDYQLKEENLLSYEQFQRVFKHEQLQVSLLFNAGGAGYFSFCVIAPHLPQRGIGTPIEHENAVAEVEKYLMKREARQAREEETQKPKILVVDDSETMRHSMKLLLDDDYRVSLAASGVAAIRAVTLDRPDLVLLDYEMPVCDGKQTLEMLRSEPDLADIPVIFLTGRNDPELLKTLLALEPAGCLLKYMKPADIKRKIDSVFRRKNS